MFSIRKIIADFGLNFIASASVAAMLNFFIYPFIARQYDIYMYGEILVLIGIVNTLFSTLGNTLNNTRLLENNNYLDKNINGDFQKLNIISALFGGIIGIAITYVVWSVTGVSIVVLFVLCFVGIMRAYYIVDYRLTLNFKRQLISNSFLIIGYIIGCLVFLRIQLWLVIFLIGEGFSFIYVIYTSKVVYEKFNRTIIFNNTLKTYITLILMSLLGNLIAYSDRFLICPLLGNEMVSIFTVAAFWGKCLAIVFEPVAGVLLGYFTQKNFFVSRKWYIKFYLFSLVIIVAFWIIGCFASPILLKILYPTIFSLAKQYIWAATAATLLGISSTLIRPLVLSFTNKKYVLYLQLLFCIVYLATTVHFSAVFGLYGFIIGIAISNTVFSLGMFILGLKHFKIQKSQ